jgi:hypothetical protein
LFILNGIINSVNQKESKPIDIQLFDIQQCFDLMWDSETMNDMFEVSNKNEKLSLVYESGREAFIAINTPFGQTERVKVENIETQGTKITPIKVSIQIDSIGKECILTNMNLYSYKKLLNIPPLSLIDDVAGITECGQKSIQLNCFINAKVEMKKLWFGETKCHQIHIGHENINCPELKIHNSIMSKVPQDKYLGNVIAGDGQNKKNVEERRNKAIGITVQIMTLLEEVCLGHHYFETAVLLRESLFINGILFNIEVCYGLTKEEVNTFEAVDRILLRKILQGHSKTPGEALYLELGPCPNQVYNNGKMIKFPLLYFE